MLLWPTPHQEIQLLLLVSSEISNFSVSTKIVFSGRRNHVFPDDGQTLSDENANGLE